MNKKKILNDPVYGFIPISSELIFEIIEHPFFQRLRRLRQLGIAEYVYPGALHTRFQHAIGATYLMLKALNSLKSKGVEISNDEYEAAQVAILLHDIGHGPLSHALEYSLLQGVSHESISYQLMQYFNKIFDNRLELSLKIFRDSYERKFFHQLISSQLDVDRMDYLKRDSFFTGVSEGTIGVERILKMLNVVNDNIVVEQKGIYSIENFINARRLMYWQVYLHKTTLSAECMVTNIIDRAKYLSQSGHKLYTSPTLRIFLKKNCTLEDFQRDNAILEAFGDLDDYDLWGAIKAWQHDSDFILSTLSKKLIKRELFKITLVNEPFQRDHIESLQNKISKQYNILRSDSHYLLSHGEVSNKAYIASGQNINVLTKKGEVIDIAKASDLPNIKAISNVVKKYYLSHPKNMSL